MKFTIRDVLWLTVVVGLASGWWAEHYRKLGETFSPGVALGPPTDQEVIRVWEVQNGSRAATKVLLEYDNGTVIIAKEKLASYTDKPFAGYQVEHAHYRCQIECPRMNLSDTVFVDRSHRRPTDNGP